MTDGHLRGSGLPATWFGQVPLGRPFPVRAPVWDWGNGRNLIENPGNAIGVLVVIALFDGVGAVVVLGGLKNVPRTAARRLPQSPLIG